MINSELVAEKLNPNEVVTLLNSKYQESVQNCEEKAVNCFPGIAINFTKFS